MNLECDEGLTEGIEKWSKNGLARGCYENSLRHGRWIFWEEGYLNLEGFYRRGVKHGPWTVFRPDGSVFTEIVFEDGVKTKKTLFSR